MKENKLLRRKFRFMKNILKQHKKWLFPGAFLVMLFGLALIWFGLTQSITVFVDSEPSTVRTTAFTVSGALRTGGIPVDEADRVVPTQSRRFWNQAAIKIVRARDVLIMTPDEMVSLFTAERIPANLMLELGITLFPQDQVIVNGEVVDPRLPLNSDRSVLLQYKPAIPVRLIIGDQELSLYTSQPTLGEALESALIYIAPQDWISEDLMTPVTNPLEVTIRRSRPVTVVASDASVTGLTAATTVGDALQDIGFPLQNLDYSLPEDNAPVPENGQITVVRVKETLMIGTEEFPHENEYQEDPETLLDTVSVMEPGQNGIVATRERMMFENGEEVWRDGEESWQASETEPGILGVGTKVEIRTEVIDGQEIEYWRKINVYATAYSPCRHGTSDCRYGTATGMPVAKGTVAVTPRWISVPNGYGMWGQPVYIPGYGRGAIGDTGGGIPGTPWIDLAYSDDDFVSWNRWTTMYFLTPVPGWVPTIIYP